ncbi:glutaminyl-peptide cyclotransferase [Lojkania enalia]|uniref:Peptide hydrolase n=1 Tax=Lojkania enalia TaxID=147567 RepID=A0A9P4K457_9PLEO|nr:glutaminyl-peptide cyclotransferase [Didymosphaeria enalia]
MMRRLFDSIFFVILCLQFLSWPTLVSAYKPLSDSFLKAVPSPGSDFDIDNGALLAPILITRVPGTPGHSKVQHHFVNFFRSELPKWTIEWQNSSSTTPVSGNVEVPFANLIFKREPPWVKPGQSNLLTLVAHYDSKYEPHGFIGATDSAAPIAMLMHAARSIDKYITQMHDEMAKLGERGTVKSNMGVQILLLDGEEAFKDWTDTDSLYGSRSLAETWSGTHNPALSTYRSPLSQISMFVLLDLLGSVSPIVPSYFLTTHWAYQNMAKIEERMRELDLLESKPVDPFLPESNRTNYPVGISDDHLPFMARGVPILHIIPSPFPDVWHTMRDDGEHLDMPTVRDWAKIVTAFTLEWLEMMEIWDEPEEVVVLS